MRMALALVAMALAPVPALAGGMLETLFPRPDSCWHQVLGAQATGPHAGIVALSLRRDGSIDREHGQMPLVPRLELSGGRQIAGWALCAQEPDRVVCHLELDGGSLVLRADGPDTLRVSTGPRGALIDTGGGAAHGLAPDPGGATPFRLTRADPRLCD